MGRAKNIVFNDLNDLIKPIRDKYLELESRKSDTEEILQTNAKEVRTHTQSLIKKVKEFFGNKEALAINFTYEQEQKSSSIN
ncbi:MAG: hypothetical protein Ct9H90mP19_3710 [Gammaproteobacteria bacterium]|nr:MAG: hypothetical protein Ct9H90mP19_3710 [Gammaproteobacteria bacterium]